MQYILTTSIGVAYIVDSSTPGARAVSDADAEQMLARNYAIQRQAEYPPLADLADALVKKSASDPMIAADGAAQEVAYYTACLAIKAKYPKPTQVL